MPDNITIGLIDFTGKRTSFGFSVEDITGATLGTYKTSLETMVSYLDALSLCNVQTTNIAVSEKFDVQKPTSTGANRELAVRFVFRDPDMNKTSVSLGGADMALFPFAAQGVDIITFPYGGTLNANITNLIGEIQSSAVHPISGGELTIFSMEKVGRNL